jgi:hypothetical protein
VGSTEVAVGQAFREVAGHDAEPLVIGLDLVGGRIVRFEVLKPLVERGVIIGRVEGRLRGPPGGVIPPRV